MKTNKRLTSKAERKLAKRFRDIRKGKAGIKAINKQVSYEKVSI